MQAGEIDGEKYYFTTQEQMLKDIANNQFIEYGQFDGNYYGTKFDTIRQCIRSGRMCILDISPQVGGRPTTCCWLSLKGRKN